MRISGEDISDFGRLETWIQTKKRLSVRTKLMNPTNSTFHCDLLSFILSSCF